MIRAPRVFTFFIFCIYRVEAFIAEHQKMQKMRNRRYLSEDSADPVFIRKDPMPLGFLMEFFEILNRIRFRMTEKYWLKEAGLFPDLPFEKQKEVLVALSELSSVSCLRVLESLATFIGPEHGNWYAFALENAHLYLQSEMLDSPMVMIGGPSGGDGERLRGYLVAVGKKSLTQLEAGFLKGIFEDVSELHNSILEEMEFEGDYCVFQFLLHFDVSLQSLWDSVCCETDLLQEEYYATNVQKPDSAMIEKWLSGDNSELGDEI